MQAYARNRQTVQNAAIDGKPLAEAILQLAALGRCADAATALLKTLRKIVPQLTDDPQTLPRQLNKLARKLKRIQPILRSRRVEPCLSREGANENSMIH